MTKLLCSTTSLLTALCLTGCVRDETPAVSQTEAAIRAGDPAQMWKLYSAWAKTHAGGGAMPLDFANDTHLRIIQNHLRTAGKTAANSPELFARLGSARLKAQAAAARGLVAEAEPWCGQEIPFGNAVTGQYTASSMFGCTGGSDYSFADVTAYATTTELTDFVFLQTVNNEDFAAKFLQTDRVAGRAAPSPGRILFMDSITLAFDDVQDFAGYEPVLAANAVPDRPSSLGITHPHEIQGNAPDNPIRVCLFREHIQVGPNQDCDYGTVLYNNGRMAPFDPTANGIAAALRTAAAVPWTPDPDPTAYFPAGKQLVPQNGNPVVAYLPLQGTYDAGAVNRSDCTNDVTSGKAQIFLLQTGGTCKGITVGDAVTGTVDLPWMVQGQDNPVWTFSGLLDFGATCLTNLQDIKLTISVTNDRSSCGPGRGQTTEISPIDFRNSCIAEGSQIALGSGQTVAVEKLAIGDKVVASTRGSVLTVQAISHGFEPFAMVRLRDDKGHKVTVTSKHPMLLETGSVIAADKLVVGDKLMTNKGATRLVAVDRVKHNGQVFNFVLGSEQELASLGPDDRTLFANGFLVGDSVMQHHLEDREKTLPSLASRVRTEWRRDYDHAVARKTVAAR
jgi:hypothetical protein